MTTFAVGIYISYDDEYLQRIDNIHKALYSFDSVWSEIPSLALIETSETIEMIESRLLSAGLDREKDLLLVLDVTGRDFRATGGISRPETLERLLALRADGAALPPDAREPGRPFRVEDLPPLDNQPPAGRITETIDAPAREEDVDGGSEDESVTA